MEVILGNAVKLAGPYRKETRDGVEYYVAPVTMIVPGVLNGNNGPLLYKGEDLGEDPDIWNGIPIVVNHPKINGKYRSARHPDVLEKFGIGTVYEARFLGALNAEAWFDPAKTRKKAPTIYDDLVNGRPIEVSTGLGARYTKSPGTFNNVDYTHVVDRFRPDHLAVLTNAPGACSVDDGCGVNPKPNAFRRVINALLGVLTNEPSDKIDPDKACKILHDGMVKGNDLTDQQRKMFAAACGDTNNEEWDVYNRSWPQEKRDKLPKEDFAGPDESFPIATQQDLDAAIHAIGRAKDPEVVKAGIKRIAKRKGLKLPDTPTWNETPTIEVDNMATRAQNIEFLTVNCDCWKNKKAVLENAEAFTDADLEKLAANERNNKVIVNALSKPVELGKKKVVLSLKDGVLNAKPAEDVADGGADDAEENPDGTKKKPTKNQSLANWLKDPDSAPREVKVAVQNMINDTEKAKRQLARQIANASKAQDKDEVFNRYMQKDLDVLQELAADLVTNEAAPPPQEGFLLNLVGGGSRPATYNEKEEQAIVNEMTPPVMDFSKPKEKVA